ncbi:hypothetical protein ScPMuIL_016208 [Solemya velum]
MSPMDRKLTPIYSSPKGYWKGVAAIRNLATAAEGAGSRRTASGRYTCPIRGEFRTERLKCILNMPSKPDEAYYASEQITIPPALPDILKQFTKAAIRTQPKDVLAWSSAYFRAMAKGEVPPVKERLEMPVATQKTDSGLTPGMLRIMHKQLGSKKTIQVALIEEKWLDLALPKEQYDDLIRIGNFGVDVEWIKFFAIACAALGESITDAMRIVCEILTSDPEGGPSRITLAQFKEIYSYLAQIDGEITQQQVDEVLNFMSYEAEKQDKYVQPRNFLGPECPKLS